MTMKMRMFMLCERASKTDRAREKEENKMRNASI